MYRVRAYVNTATADKTDLLHGHGHLEGVSARGFEGLLRGDGARRWHGGGEGHSAWGDGDARETA